MPRKRAEVAFEVVNVNRQLPDRLGGVEKQKSTVRMREGSQLAYGKYLSG
jgi:hypothetical protein